MKKFILLSSSILLFFISCSSENDTPQEEELTACFEMSNTTVEVGEEIQISNCSVGAVSYEFTFDNKKSNEKNPLISFENAGTQNISLKVTSESGKTSLKTKSVIVNAIEDSYVYKPDILEGDTTSPINFGYNGSSFYYIENYNNVNSSNQKYNYIEIDLTNKNFTSKYISEKEYNSSNAFLTTLDNNDKLFYAVRSLSDRIGLTEVKLNSNWVVQSDTNSQTRVLYGSLQNNNDYLFYGSYRIISTNDPNYSLYKSPSIEIRNSAGEITERKTFYEIEQGFIGDLIKNEDGFIAFGGMTSPTGFSTFENYRPLIIFLNSNYEYINHIVYDNTEISTTNNNDLNGSYHIKKLSNNNIVLYSHNELRIINSVGTEILKEAFSTTQSNIQSLISLDNEGFILSTHDYLKKYDVNGTLIKSIKFGGAITPNLILKDSQIYFVSGYDTQFTNNIGTFAVRKTFIGSVNTDLKINNLN